MTIATYPFACIVGSAPRLPCSWWSRGDWQCHRLLPRTPRVAQSGVAFRVASRGEALPPLKLAARGQAEQPDLRVTYVPLEIEPGHALVVGLAGRLDPVTSQLSETRYAEVFVDPVTGERLGERRWNACCVERKQADAVSVRDALQPPPARTPGVMADRQRRVAVGSGLLRRVLSEAAKQKKASWRPRHSAPRDAESNNARTGHRW